MCVFCFFFSPPHPEPSPGSQTHIFLGREGLPPSLPSGFGSPTLRSPPPFGPTFSGPALSLPSPSSSLPFSLPPSSPSSSRAMLMRVLPPSHLCSPWVWEGERREGSPPSPGNGNTVSVFFVLASPVEGVRRLQTNTAYAHLWGLGDVQLVGRPKVGFGG